MRHTYASLTTFRHRLVADAEVPGSPEQVYALLRDPDFVASSAPFVRRIVPVAEDRWRWEMGGIRYPGGTFTASFTQHMTFDPPHAVAFRHDPGPGVFGESRGSDNAELAGAEGVLRVSPAPVPGATVSRSRLDVEIEVSARVPAPRAAAKAVEGAMHVVLVLIRDQFVRSLRRALEAA